ncbi:aldehyde:ferredoxin oxidoreductase [Clostridiales bacterium PH28_bin88]|nr:aldehyde:ferredoxin oxidoreductase [Clostridiales bacterium PH28_bin88]
MPYGYNGRILRVNLSSGEISEERPDELFYRTYMGGSCIAAYYLLREMKPNIDPLGPDNILVFADSVVTGAPAPGFNRYTVGAKSPLTGGIGESQAAGFWGPELKFAGYDAIVIKGQSPKPVYLWIKDGKVEIRDAAHLWGRTTGEAQKLIREELNDVRVRIALIGPAGENLVRYACIVNELKHANGRTGMGAVMGSKNLKAIAVRGTNKPEFYNKDTITRLAKHFAANFLENPSVRGTHRLGTSELVSLQNVTGQLPTRNFRSGYFENADDISAEAIHEKLFVKAEGCYACPVTCKRVLKADHPYHVDPAYGGPEYESIAALGSACGVSDVVAVAKANELCNAFGLDTVSAGMSIAFAMECFENGLISREEANGLELKFGNANAMVRLVEAIAKRDGLGNLLAEGVKRSAEKLGKGSERFAMHVKGAEFPMHEPRVKGMLGLSYAVSPLGADHLTVEHDTDFDFNAPQVFLDQATPLGLLRRLPTSTIDSDKVRMFCYLQPHFSFLDVLGLCIFTFGPVRFFTMTHLVELVSAITGWETSLWEIMKAGERRVHMLRVFNCREGFNKKDDWLPERMFSPIEDGPAAGNKLDQEEFKDALKLYYEMMNWDVNTGIPSKAKLLELDLGWLLPEVESRQMESVS